MTLTCVFTGASNVCVLSFSLASGGSCGRSGEGQLAGVGALKGVVDGGASVEVSGGNKGDDGDGAAAW